MEKNRRVYIRRKRCLKESQKMIYDVLTSIAIARGEEIDEQKLSREALDHATTIEASCWSPKLHITDEEFQSLTMNKTQELCKILIKYGMHQQDKNTRAYPLPNAIPITVTPTPRKIPKVTPSGITLPSISIQSTPPIGFFQQFNTIPLQKAPTIINLPQPTQIPPQNIFIAAEPQSIISVPIIQTIQPKVTKPHFASLVPESHVFPRLISKTPENNNVGFKEFDSGFSLDFLINHGTNDLNQNK